MSPRVTIGLPVYNGERFLEQTIDALLAQTYPDFELVVSDNGSSDRTEEICRSAAARDARVRYHRSPVNRGAAWNFNRVFELAQGKCFKWSASDDLCEPTFVERCVEALDAVPGAVLAYPRARFIDEHGHVIRDHDDALDLGEHAPHDRLRRLIRTLGYANALHGVIRAEALRQTRLHGAYPSSDYVLLAELALLGTFIEVPDRLFLRRLHPEMSRRANPGAAEATVWFRPDAELRYRTEAWPLVAEHLRAIARAPLPVGERLRCAIVFARVGGRRYGHHLVRELRELAAERARRGRGDTTA